MNDLESSENYEQACRRTATYSVMQMVHTFANDVPPDTFDVTEFVEHIVVNQAHGVANVRHRIFATIQAIEILKQYPALKLTSSEFTMVVQHLVSVQKETSKKLEMAIDEVHYFLNDIVQRDFQSRRNPSLARHRVLECIQLLRDGIRHIIDFFG